MSRNGIPAEWRFLLVIHVESGQGHQRRMVRRDRLSGLAIPAYAEGQSGHVSYSGELVNVALGLANKMGMA